jgi:hypothetical protein
MNTNTTINKPPLSIKKFLLKIRSFKTATKFSIGWLAGLATWFAICNWKAIVVLLIFLITVCAFIQIVWVLSRELDRQESERARHYGK